MQSRPGLMRLGLVRHYLKERPDRHAESSRQCIEKLEPGALHARLDVQEQCEIDVQQRSKLMAQHIHASA